MADYSGSTNPMTLEQVVDKLSRQQIVDGLVIVGSAARGEVIRRYDDPSAQAATQYSPELVSWWDANALRSHVLN